MNTPSNSKNSPKPIISEDVADKLTSAYHTIFSLMASYGETIAVPTDKTGPKEWERVAARGFSALAARAAHIKEQEVAAFRQGVRDALAPHFDRARGEKAEYDALSPTLKAKLGAFPTFVTVPLSDVSDVFGEGTDIPVQVKKLTDMGYKMVKGANNTFSLRVDLPKSILEPAAL